MKKLELIVLLIIVLGLSFSCKKDQNNNHNNPTPSSPGVVSTEGINAWDNLTSTEQLKINTWNSLFIHQSVGQDIEDGAEFNNFKFEYFDGSASITDKGLYGGLFRASNGDPIQKITEFKNHVNRNKSQLKVVCFKFGYADIESSTRIDVQNAYKAMVDGFRADGIRVLHITPPLVYDVAYNEPKMQVRTWMIETFKNDVIFDLQDIESKNLDTGVRSEVGGIWQICDDNRSTVTCPSKGQGIDTPAQGHLCELAARKIAKAFLYAIYQSGK